jgi:hypothetical protein
VEVVVLMAEQVAETLYGPSQIRVGMVVVMEVAGVRQTTQAQAMLAVEPLD